MNTQAVPQLGNPVIDHMPVCVLADDQVGTPRPVGNGCDSGAAEVGEGLVGGGEGDGGR